MTRGQGATLLGGGSCRFRVWAPRARRVGVRLIGSPSRLVPLEPAECGYHEAVVEGVRAGDRYLYRLDDGAERPDPASLFQPEGVHGPSQVVEPFPASDTEPAWRGLPLERFVFYEVHVGTFTDEGSLDAVIPHLDRLADLGVTVIELMPVAQFPGERNWGYDGVCPYAVQNSYGGPDGLRRLVGACHDRGLGVALDVVYNHLGPEGNYLSEFGPYFSGRYATPWGPAMNFDGPGSDEVRRYFIDNALYWVLDHGIDALRLDAVHGILDMSARPFLAELAETVTGRAREANRNVVIVSESDLNDVRVILPPERGGHGHDAQWNDDFHHAVHALLTGERHGYYRDFGGMDHLTRAFTEGFVYTGQFSEYRQRRHGSPSREIPARRFVVFSQNHDQVGNRMKGDRLSGGLVSFEALKLAAGLVLLSPYIPLLFMGEEYGETAPFQYFVSHSDPALVEAVREGRRKEFAAFDWEGEPPDPQDEQTFRRSKLDHGLEEKGKHSLLRAFHAELLRLRRELPALRRPGREGLEVVPDGSGRMLTMMRGTGADRVAVFFSMAPEPARVGVPLPAGPWVKRLDSSAREWGGPGGDTPERIGAGDPGGVTLAAESVVMYAREA